MSIVRPVVFVVVMIAIGLLIPFGIERWNVKTATEAASQYLAAEQRSDVIEYVWRGTRIYGDTAAAEVGMRYREGRVETAAVQLIREHGSWHVQRVELSPPTERIAPPLPDEIFALVFKTLTTLARAASNHSGAMVMQTASRREASLLSRDIQRVLNLWPSGYLPVSTDVRIDSGSIRVDTAGALSLSVNINGPTPFALSLRYRMEDSTWKLAGIAYVREVVH